MAEKIIFSPKIIISDSFLAVVLINNNPLLVEEHLDVFSLRAEKSRHRIVSNRFSSP